MGKFLKEKYVKTRKEQVCWGCTNTFEKGSLMLCNTSIDGISIFNSYFCKECVDKINKINWKEDDCLGFGDLLDYEVV